MVSDVRVRIFDPRVGAVVHSRWLGMSGVRDEIAVVLKRVPDHKTLGKNWWGRITADDVVRMCKARYQYGPTTAELTRLAAEFPEQEYWWILEHDY